MEVQTLPDALKLIMERRGWSQTDLAHELGVSQAWVSEVSRGQKDTGINKATKLLARVGWEVRISPKREDPVERRDFLAAAASVIFMPSTRATPYQDANYVETLTKSLASNRYTLGGTPLATSALKHVRHLGGALDRSADGNLQRAASQLMDQAALILYDAGMLTEADRVGGIALRLAHNAGDLKGKARAYATLSRVHLYKGDFARAITFAQRGIKVPDLPSSQQATLYMRLGRSLAFVPGQEKTSRDVLENALNVSGLSPFGEAALIGDVGIALGALRNYREAGDLLSTAAESIGQWSPVFRAQYLGRQIQTALRASDPSFAADRMHILARALPFVASARVNKRVAEILDASQKWDNEPEMRQAREHLRTVFEP